MTQNRWHLPLPHEHGAWAMFIAPLVTGFGAAEFFDLNALLLTLTVLGFFMLRFPLMVVIRYASRVPQVRANAIQWSVIYAAFTAVCGAVLLFSTRLWELVPIAALGGMTLIVYLALVARREEMSVAGEWLGIAGLALGAPAAYLLGRHVLDADAFALFALNVLYFGGTVVYIKFKVRQQPRVAAKNWVERLWFGRISIVYHAIVLAFATLSAAAGWIPALVVLTFILPMCKVLGGVLTQPARLNIRRLGLIELGFTLAFVFVVVTAYH